MSKSVEIPRRFRKEKFEDKWRKITLVRYSVPGAEYEGYVFDVPLSYVKFGAKRDTVWISSYYPVKCYFLNPEKGTRHKRYSWGYEDLVRVYAEVNREVEEKRERRKADFLASKMHLCRFRRAGAIEGAVPRDGGRLDARLRLRQYLGIPARARALAR